MTPSQIEELLNQQADRLVAGDELPGGQAQIEAVSIGSSAGLSRQEQGLLDGLMLLARRLRVALVEVEPRPAFVKELKAKLLVQRQAEARHAGATGRGLLWVAGLAGALSMASLGFLSYRVARAGLSWISSASAGRNARPALPKP